MISALGGKVTVIVVVAERWAGLVLEAAPCCVIDLIVLIRTVRVGIIPGGEDAPRTTAELCPDEVTGILVPVAASGYVSGTDQYCRAWRLGFARVSNTVAIGVRLVHVGHVRAVVLGVRHGVVVGVGRRGAAVIALVAHAVAVVVALLWVVNVRAIIRGVRHGVVVGIGRGRRTVIARVAHAVAVAVVLVRVVNVWAVIRRFGHTV